MPADQNPSRALEIANPAKPGPAAFGNRGIAIGLALLTLLVYVRVSSFDFLDYDDFANVFNNPYLNPVSWSSLFFFWRHSYYLLYMPVTYTVWAGLAAVAGLPHPVATPATGPYTLDPHVFHTANLCFHILNVLLVYALLRCFVKRDWAAAAGALLFGLHPAQVEPVAFITGLNNLLSGAGVFVALRQYTLYARAASDGLPTAQRRAHYAWATLAFALALLAKPTAVTVPFMAWVLDRWMVGRSARACTRPLIAWAAMALLCVKVTQSVQSPHRLVPTPLFSRPLVAGDALDFFLVKLFVPLNLCPHYGRTPEWLFDQPWRYLTVLPPLVLGAVIWSNRRRYPWLLAGACLFVLGVLPVLGLVPTYSQFTSTVADRYLYVTLLGPALLLACLLDRGRPRADGAAAIALLVLAALSWRQTGYWRDTQTLFEYTLRVNPQSWLAHDALGDVLEHEGRHKAAIAEYQEAVRLHPNVTNARDDLGIVFLTLHQLDAAQACFVAALAIDPQEELAHVNLGMVYFEKGQFDRAVECYQAALRDNPDSESAHYEMALALTSMGNAREAARHLEQVLNTDPHYALAHLALANLLDEQGYTELAQSHYIQAVKLTPDAPVANTDYGLFLLNHDRAALALPYLVKAVTLGPRDAQARNNLGLALGRQEQFSQAADQFSAAIALDPRFVKAHYNLGMMQAREGHTAQAVTEWRRALAIDGSFALARQALTGNTVIPGAPARP